MRRGGKSIWVLIIVSMKLLFTTGTDDCCKERLSNFVVLMWDAEGTRTLRKFNTTTPDPFVTISLDGRSAKIIKIQSKLSGTALNLAEVEVFGRTQ